MGKDRFNRAERREFGDGRAKCSALHPSRKDGDGNPLRCNRDPDHNQPQHKVRIKSGYVWWS